MYEPAPMQTAGNPANFENPVDTGWIVPLFGKDNYSFFLLLVVVVFVIYTQDVIMNGFMGGKKRNLKCFPFILTLINHPRNKESKHKRKAKRGRATFAFRPFSEGYCV